MSRNEDAEAETLRITTEYFQFDEEKLETRTLGDLLPFVFSDHRTPGMTGPIQTAIGALLSFSDDMRLLALLLGSDDVDMDNGDLERIVSRLHDRAFVATELVRRMAIAEGLLSLKGALLKPDQPEQEGPSNG